MNVPRAGLNVAAAILFLAAGCTPTAATPSAIAPTAAPPQAPAASGSRTTVRLADARAIAPQLPVLAAERFGLYERNGLEAQLTAVGDFPATFNMLVGKQVDAMLATPDQVIAANSAGARFKGVLSSLNVTLINLVTNPTITTVQDLRGKTGASANASDIRVFLTNRYLRQNGLDP